MTTDRRTTDLLDARRAKAHHSVVGVDGGGTKTEAVIMDANMRVIGEGRAGASNPLRVGVTSAAAAVREARTIGTTRRPVAISRLAHRSVFYDGVDCSRWRVVRPGTPKH